MELQKIINNNWMVSFGGFDIESMIDKRGSYKRLSHDSLVERERRSSAAKKRSVRLNQGSSFIVEKRDDEGKVVGSYKSVRSAAADNKVSSHMMKLACLSHDGRVRHRWEGGDVLVPGAVFRIVKEGEVKA